MNTHPLWFKNAVFYAIIVETFADGNNDGIGDFIGLTEKLDYLARLGITCIWLLPFFLSPRKDDGYDVSDYYAIDPRYGTMEDFFVLLQEAKRLGLRVLIDLVVNHTSDQHPWFIAARSGDPKYKDYYIWVKDVPAAGQPESMFSGVESSAWQYEESAQQYYYHTFYHFQPDLNMSNLYVQQEVDSIIRFWMEKGVDGFRMDAVKHIFVKAGTDIAQSLHPDMLMQHWNQVMKTYNAESVLLGESNVDADKVPLYFGNGDRLEMMFNFMVSEYMFLALAKKEAIPLVDLLQTFPIPAKGNQWVNFLRNHDELNLGRLQKGDQETIYQAFAPDKDMQIYGRGLRRRLAPMLDGDMQRLKMVYALLFALPGALMIYYGDEIGMGDNLALPERMGVRTPMQWTNEKNAGFSGGESAELVRPVITGGDFGYEKVNVKQAEETKGSLLEHIKGLIQLKKDHPVLGSGVYKPLVLESPHVFGLAYEGETERLMVFHNLSDQEENVSVKEYGDREVEEIFADAEYAPVKNSLSIQLKGYGWRWFRVGQE